MANDRRSVTVVVRNRLGMHARPAMNFVDVAVGYTCDVRVRRGDQEVDGKSIMQMLMLAATKGAELEIITEGADADAALRALKDLVDGGFGEE